jgi:hypothetical protein
MNSGSTIRRALHRGARTFQPISKFPFGERRRTRSPSDALVELVVAGGVPDIMEHVIAASKITPESSTELWRRPRSDAKERPRP